MRIDLLHDMGWEHWSGSFAQDFAQPRGWIQGTDQQGRMYRGLAHAVTEVVLGSALFLSHKKSVTVVQGESWAFEMVLPQLYKMGFQVREIHRPRTEDGAAWINELPAETNCVLWSEDHPVTGAFEDRSQWSALLSKRRIHSVVISHSAYWFRPQNVEPYGVRLMSIGEDFCWGTLGPRFRTPPLCAHRMSWPADKLARLMAELEARSPLEDQKRVDDFETQLVGLGLGFERHFYSRDRIWDRAVVFHPGYNADALKEAWGSDSAEVQSLVRCTREAIPHFHQWWQPLPSPEVLGGTLVLGLSQLDTRGLEQRVRKALTNCSFESK